MSCRPNLFTPLLLTLVLGAVPAAGRHLPEGFTGCYALSQSGMAREPIERRVLDDENTDRLFTPASVTKLVTVMAALELLGPGYRVETSIYPSGRGDLVLVGAGDPTWSQRFTDGHGRAALESLARQVASHVRRVEGDLVLDVSRFPGRPFPPSRGLAEIAYAYGAPTGALALEDNTAWLRIEAGAQVGEPATVSWDGPAPYRLDNRTITASEARHDKGTFDVLPSWQGHTLVVRGEYPISEPPYRLPVALHDGEQRVGMAMLEALAVAGVEVRGGLRLSRSSAVPAQSALIATVLSPPVSDWLREILNDSDNWLAEMLLRQIALRMLGEGRTDDGAEFLVAELTKRAGLIEGSLELEDGSGLSPYDLVTPRAVVDLLIWARTRRWWPIFRESLATPGNGTLAAWPGLPAGTRAKTGTLQHTVALAGYVGDGPGSVAFACFVNHATEERPVLRRRLAGRVAGWGR